MAADFTHLELHRRYLKAQGGIDHSFVWDFPGWAGDGVNVGVLDVNFRPHEDLPGFPIIVGEEHADPTYDHGTLMAGIIAAKHDNSGYLGIAPRVSLVGGIISPHRDKETHKSTRQLANILNPGDIICMPAQRAGPLATTTGTYTTSGAIPYEWWQEDYDAIRYATERGVIVVVAAANGEYSLADAIYNTPYTGAPTHWKNAFDRSVRDSGSIMVGAASPGQPRETNHGTLASRLGFSCYGPNVDASAWGKEVTVLRNYKPPGQPGNYYTTDGGGTSAATAIVAGCLASVQGALKAAGKPLLTPATARAMLRATGLAQASGTFPASQRIGSLVNLRDMYEYVGVAARPTPVAAPEPAPEPVLTPPPFLLANGVRVPLELGSARRVNNRDKTERALSGAPLTSRFKTKESFSFKTLPLSLYESEMVNGIFQGKGEGCDYNLGDLYTAKGLREISGATYASNNNYHQGNLLNAGIHPVYDVQHLNTYYATGGTFFMAFRAPSGSTAAALGTLAMFYGTGQDSTSYAPYSEIQATSTVVRFRVYGDDVPGAYMDLPSSLIKSNRLNVLAVSWGPGGDTQFAINSSLAQNNMPNPTWQPYVAYVALGERWGYQRRGTWADGTRPLNYRVGQWGLWPFQVSPDDLIRLSNGVFNGYHPAPPPYIKGAGVMLSAGSEKTLRCEGRVTGVEYQQADQVVLTLEMDEV